MKTRGSALALLLLALLVLITACGPISQPARSPVAGVTSTATRAPTATATPVPTATPTSAPTSTSTPARTPTAAPTSPPTPTPTATPAPAPPRADIPGAPIAGGQVILVSLSRQWLYAYNNGVPAFNNAVETGAPELPTPTGHFSILSKSVNVTFVSPWPEGSPFHYEPTHVNYALEFKRGGYFLHDAWWHVVFGPGGNVPHRLPDGRWETGSHGCIGMTIPDAERLYMWSRIGTPVIIVN